MNIRRGEYVIKEGEDGNSLFLVESGNLKCYKKEGSTLDGKMIREFGPGDSFGE